MAVCLFFLLLGFEMSSHPFQSLLDTPVRGQEVDPTEAWITALLQQTPQPRSTVQRRRQLIQTKPITPSTVMIDQTPILSNPLLSKKRTRKPSTVTGSGVSPKPLQSNPKTQTTTKTKPKRLKSLSHPQDISPTKLDQATPLKPKRLFAKPAVPEVSNETTVPHRMTEAQTRRMLQNAEYIQWCQEQNALPWWKSNFSLEDPDEKWTPEFVYQS